MVECYLMIVAQISTVGHRPEKELLIGRKHHVARMEIREVRSLCNPHSNNMVRLTHIDDKHSFIGITMPLESMIIMGVRIIVIIT